jgi:hypothetical protein
MSSTPIRRIPVVANVARAARTEAYLTIVSPTWPWGYLRLAGMALIAEGLFLLLFALAVPVGGLALISLLVGEGAFVASFAAGVRPVARERPGRPPAETRTPPAHRDRWGTGDHCRVEHDRPRCRRRGQAR